MSGLFAQFGAQWIPRSVCRTPAPPPTLPLEYCCSYSVTQLCPILCNPWTAALQAPLSFTVSKFAQIHVHWVCDAKPFHSLPPPAPFPFNLSQH